MQRGIPRYPCLENQFVIDQVNSDVHFGDGLPPKCLGFQDFKQRRLALLNMTGLFYHRQFDHSVNKIISVTFWRVPNTKRMEEIQPLTHNEIALLRGMIELRPGIYMNFFLAKNKLNGRFYCPKKFQ